MTAADLNSWLRALHPVAEPSVDRIIVGDPTTEVRALANVWLPTWPALRAAVAAGANVVVAHEPTFYTHWDLDHFDDAFAALAPEARTALVKTRDEKRRWMEAQGLVLIRCHDVPDRMPLGVVDALLTELGFASSEIVATSPNSRVVRFSPVSAGELAQRLASTFSALGQPGVAFYGDAARVVRTLGLGTGYSSNLWNQLALGAEMSVAIDDAVQSWSHTAYAEDSGYPLVVINHGTSEEWGVRRVGAMLRAAFPGLPVHHLAQGCGYRWISGAGISS